jgi:hypothetical protein
MTTLWLREVEARFTGAGGDLVVSRLRIAFRVSKSLSGTPNVAEIKVWNLSQANRYKVKREFDRVRLEAGHVAAGNRGIIFDGFVRDVMHSREGADIVTTVECGDGDRAYRQGTIARTFPAGARPREMVDALLETMPDVDRGVIEGLDELPAYPRPVTMYGRSVDEMNKLGRTHRFYWSVQDGALEVLPGRRAMNEVVVISRTSGMVGVPDITDNGILVETLLNPELRIGRTIEVRSEQLALNDDEARFRISALDFTGDTRANEYFARVHGERIDGGEVQEE